MHFAPHSNSRILLKGNLKINNRWISISNIFFYNFDLTILIVIFAARVTQGTCLHCKYAELDNKTAHFTIFEG